MQYTVEVENKYFVETLTFEAESPAEAIEKAKAAPEIKDLTGRLRYRVIKPEGGHAHTVR